VTDVAIVPNNLSGATHVFAIVTTKTARGIEVSDIVWVSGPIRLHFREKVSLENTLRLADCRLNGIRLLSM
jgi:hypothetical protein